MRFEASLPNMKHGVTSRHGNFARSRASFVSCHEYLAIRAGQRCLTLWILHIRCMLGEDWVMHIMLYGER